VYVHRRTILTVLPWMRVCQSQKYVDMSQRMYRGWKLLQCQFLKIKTWVLALLIGLGYICMASLIYARVYLLWFGRHFFDWQTLKKTNGSQNDIKHKIKFYKYFKAFQVVKIKFYKYFKAFQVVKIKFYKYFKSFQVVKNFETLKMLVSYWKS
jgi:hypothetical protein